MSCTFIIIMSSSPSAVFRTQATGVYLPYRLFCEHCDRTVGRSVGVQNKIEFSVSTGNEVICTYMYV